MVINAFNFEKLNGHHVVKLNGKAQTEKKSLMHQHYRKSLMTFNNRLRSLMENQQHYSLSDYVSSHLI